MSPLSSWQYPSCFRKGQIRQLLRTLTAYFYVSSSSLVVWAVDGQRTIHRILKQFTISVSYIFPKSPQKKKSTSIYSIFKKVTWLTFHFIMCACAVTGRGNGPGKIASWSIKTSTFFRHGSEEDYGGCCEFLSNWQCSFPCPFCQTLLRHRQGTGWGKKHSNIAAVCPCQLESMLSPDRERDRRALCLLPAWSLLSLLRKQAAQQEDSGHADKHVINKYTGCSLECRTD